MLYKEVLKMSIHPSLKLKTEKAQIRSVLKRHEKIKILMSSGQWKKEDSIFGLPKVKVVRIKIKKEKAAEKPQEAAATATATETKTSTGNPASKSAK